MPLDIKVNQQWKTRAGDVVRVTVDRASHHEGWPGVDYWRWALSNGQLVNIDGRAGFNPEVDDPNDLIELHEGE